MNIKEAHNISDINLDGLEDDIINEMSDYDSPYFDDDAVHCPDYEFIDRGFILRDGSLIDTLGYNHYNTEENIRDFLVDALEIDLDKFDKSIVHRVTDALCWIRVNGSNEDYICLPSQRPNDKQLDILARWIDDFFAQRNYHDDIRISTFDGNQQHSYKPTMTGKEVVDVVKRYYASGKLYESLEEEFLQSDSKVFATKNVYDAKNLLSRNDKAYRIFYDCKKKLFLLGPAEDLIHMDMVERAIEDGYYSGMKRWEIPGYMDDAIDNDECVVAIYTPNDLVKDTYGAKLGEDGYDDEYDYENFVVTTRYTDWKNCPLSGVLGKYTKYTACWKQDKWGNDVQSRVLANESLLTEKRRSELIDKSKNGANYTSKGRQDQNRWTRRKYSSVANSIRDYNNINMDIFFKDDILEFVIRVKGETDDYEVTITFSNILKNLQDEVRRNNNKLEFKCVLRALLTAFNSDDVFVSCTCPDFTFSGFNYYGVKQNYNSKPILGKAMQAPRIKNPLDNKGSACKHINLILANTDWMMKVASVINNYIKWCKDNMARNYADIIFPVVYGMPYDKAVQLSLFDDPDDNGYLPTDQKYISKVIDNTMKDRDEKGKWAVGNEYRFKKQDTIKSNQYPEDKPGQLKLQLDTVKSKQDQDTIKSNQEVEEKTTDTIKDKIESDTIKSKQEK